MYMRRVGLRIDVVADVQGNHDGWSWRLTCCSAAARRGLMRAAGAHMSGYHGPLQQLVMCACHRTSPTLTPLACDGLYASTSAEQRGQNLPKLLALMACHCASGANAVPIEPTLARPELWLQTLITRFSDHVRATGVRAAVNEDSTGRSEADDARARHNAAAPAPGQQKERMRGGSAAETKSLNRQRRRRIQNHRSSFGSGHITPQFSRRAMRDPARRKRIMKWRACAAPAIGYHGGLPSKKWTPVG